MSNLVGNPEDRFSRVAAPMKGDVYVYLTAPQCVHATSISETSPKNILICNLVECLEFKISGQVVR